MSHFPIWVAIDNPDNIYSIVEPFNESTEDPRYLKFHNVESEYGEKEAKRYPSKEKYMEACGYEFNKSENAYGYYSNPNAKWDWYSIGGRWKHMFLVKQSAAEIILDDSEPADASEGPVGYLWGDGARKKDIDWEKMKEIAILRQSKSFHEYETVFRNGELPHSWYAAKITDDGILDVLNQEMFYIKNESLEEYLQRNFLAPADKYLPPVYGFINKEGQWDSRGKMGWFGLSSGDMPMKEWRKKVIAFLEDTPENYFIVNVDCHI